VRVTTDLHITPRLRTCEVIISLCLILFVFHRQSFEVTLMLEYGAALVSDGHLLLLQSRVALT